MNEEDISNFILAFEIQTKEVLRRLTAIRLSFSESDIISRKEEIDYLKKELDNLKSVVEKIESLLK